MIIKFKYIFVKLIVLSALFGCQAAMYGTGSDLNLVKIGMTKSEVIAILGKPVSIGAEAVSNVEKLNYRKMTNITDWQPTSYEIVLKEGRVIKFGEVGSTSIIIDLAENKTNQEIAIGNNINKEKIGEINKLNIDTIKKKQESDAVAIIIGIQNYKKIPKSNYSNDDARMFAGYANKILGVKQQNIKMLIDDEADNAEIYRAFQNWLPLKVKKNKTDIYVFYSGHGLPSDDGNSLYFLPHGADRDFISKTAINQSEIIAALQAAQPNSVTMFIDSCYSGLTRTGDALLASARPIAIKSKNVEYPTNFTVISASSPEQISWSSAELKHGIFSYYLMKGMEGDADENKDGKITVGEMQAYLTDMVPRQALVMNRKQVPQLTGDTNRVLVGR